MQRIGYSGYISTAHTSPLSGDAGMYIKSISAVLVLSQLYIPWTGKTRLTCIAATTNLEAVILAKTTSASMLGGIVCIGTFTKNFPNFCVEEVAKVLEWRS